MGGYRDDPPASTGEKVIISDTDHINRIPDFRRWVWKSFLRGLNPIFMDTYDEKVTESYYQIGPGADRNEEIRVAMGRTKDFAERMDLIHMVPDVSISSSGYCLANAGKEYLVYIPEGNEATIDLSTASGTFNVEWFDPVSGITRKGDPVRGGHHVRLISPFESEDAIIYIKHKRGR